MVQDKANAKKTGSANKKRGGAAAAANKAATALPGREAPPYEEGS